MSLFEWFGESVDPGERGSLEVKVDRISKVWVGFMLIRFGLTLGLFFGLPLTATFWFGVAEMNPTAGLITAAAFLLYLVVGYFVRATPDTSNLGLFGGLVDHPFRWSDDWNRNLLGLQLLLFPGYVLARPVAELFYWLAGEADEV